MWTKTAIPEQSGFTLVEMAIVLLIITLALGGLLTPMARQSERKHIEDTQRQLDDIRSALLGYAVSHKHLPCPDSDALPDGLENRNGANCVSYFGALPWQDLGIGQTDAWNRHFSYAVSPAFASSSPAFSLTDNGTLTVKNTSGSGGVTYLPNAVAVVISHGINGLGAPGSATTPVSADELDNSNGGSTYVSREITTAYDISQGNTQSEFDDLVIWLPTSLLFNQMVTAGQLTSP